MGNHPLVSVVIPTYKGERKLEKTIKSIGEQTYDNIEILIIDDNDPDTVSRVETEKIVNRLKEPNTIYIKHEHNMNGAAARNTGIIAAKGKYICFLDDDDFYMPTRISECVDILENNHESSAVFCDVLQLYSNNECSVHKMKEEDLTVRGVLLYEAAIGTGSNLFLRTQAVRQIKGFDIRFLRHQDLEFVLRVLENFKYNIINKVLVIKGYNGVNNVPQYRKMKCVKELYNEKFKEQIDALEVSERNAYYINCYKSLYISALYAEDYKEAIDNLNAMEKYGYEPGIKQIIQLGLAFFHLYHRVKRLMERENGPKKSNAAVINIEELDSDLQWYVKKIE